MKFKESAMIGMDIDSFGIRVVDVGKSGRVGKMGQATFPEGVGETDRSVVLEETMKKALRSAHITSGNCAISLSGSDIILRKFVFPELPEEAMQITVATEIETYLPEPLENYVTDYRVICPVVQEDATAQPHNEVLVVAAPKKMVDGAINAAKKQNMRITRVDVRENARERFSQDDRIWKQIPASDMTQAGAVTLATFSGSQMSYAILNVGRDSSDVTMFIAGKYYVNRYISTGAKTNLFTKDLFEKGKIKPGGAEDQALDNLVTELGSIIDYAYYRERKSKVCAVQLFGQAAELQDLQDKLWNDLNIASIKPGQLLYEKMPHRLRVQSEMSIHDFLDAYAVTLEHEDPEHKDLNLMTNKGKTQKSSKTNLVAIIAGAALLVAGFLLWFFPYQMLRSNQNKLDEYKSEIQRIEESPDNADLEKNRLYAADMNDIKKDYEDFLAAYPEVEVVLDEIKKCAGSDVLIHQIRWGGNKISISGTSDTDTRLGKLIVDLNQSELFASVGTTGPVVDAPISLYGVIPGSKTLDPEGEYFNFDIDIELALNAPEATK